MIEKAIKVLVPLAALFLGSYAWSGTVNSPTIFVPPTTGSSIQFAQNTSPFISPPSQLIGQRGLTWGASSPVPGAGTGFYLPCCRDPLSTTSSATASSPHDRAWFDNNHPDWLMYPNSGSSTPSTGGGGNFWAIDIANPVIQRYMLAYSIGQCPPASIYPTCSTDLPSNLLQGVRQGYAYISMDNLSLSNAAPVQGHYGGAVAGCTGGEPACGGIWVQQYTGSAVDAAYTRDVLRYAGTMKAGLNAVGAGLWTNNKLTTADVPNSTTLALIGDANVRESPYLHACNASGATDFTAGTTPGTSWYSLLQLANATYNKQYVTHFNYLCNHPVSGATPAEIAYATANYYLVRDNWTFFEMQNGGTSGSQDAGTLITYPASVLVNLGRPMAPPPTAGQPNSSGGCYERQYEFGMVEVWPSISGSCTYTIPSVGTWTDQFGNTLSTGVNTLNVDNSTGTPRANAIVILRTS